MQAKALRNPGFFFRFTHLLTWDPAHPDVVPQSCTTRRRDCSAAVHVCRRMHSGGFDCLRAGTDTVTYSPTSTTFRSRPAAPCSTSGWRFAPRACARRASDPDCRALWEKNIYMYMRNSRDPEIHRSLYIWNGRHLRKVFYIHLINIDLIIRSSNPFRNEQLNSLLKGSLKGKGGLRIKYLFLRIVNVEFHILKFIINIIKIFTVFICQIYITRIVRICLPIYKL